VKVIVVWSTTGPRTHTTLATSRQPAITAPSSTSRQRDQRLPAAPGKFITPMATGTAYPT
jgi:hypothetical protein